MDCQKKREKPKREGHGGRGMRNEDIAAIERKIV